MPKNYPLYQRFTPWCRLALAALLGSSFAAQAGSARPTAAHPLAANDAAVSIIYTYGRLPSPRALPHAVQAVVTNAGTSALTNLPVTLNVTGANTFANTQTVATLAPGATTTVTFAAYPSTLALGTNSLAVTVPADDNSTNNSATFTQRVTAARLSYTDTTAAFNSSGASVGVAGGALAVKYTVPSATSYVAGVTATFAASTSTSASYQVLVYDATGTGGTPGTLLYTSPTRTRTAAASSTTEVIPSIPVNTAFFVALREINNGLAVATQPESPLRPNTFYFQTPGGAWTATSAQTRRALDVVLGAAPACPAPSSLTINSITSTSASVAFVAPTNGTSYRIIYGLTGFNPATGGTTVTATTSPFTLSGLITNTTYQVYVQAICGTSGSSYTSGPVSFTTACQTYTFPYTENFDGVTAPALPCGITILNANNDTGVWANGSGTASTSPNAMRYNYNSSSAADDWFFLPVLNLQAGTSYQLQFKYRNSSVVYADALEVKVGSSTDPTTQTTTLFTNSAISNITYATTAPGPLAGQVLQFTPTTSGTYYFGFHAISPSGLYSTLYVDDVNITAAPAPTCPQPTTLAVSNVTATTATVAFTGSTAGTAYSIIYGPSGFDPTTAGTTITATASPLTLSGLLASTAYQVYVRTTCGTTGTSALTGPVAFRTLCQVITNYPYTENFDGVTAPALPCITVLDANGDGRGWENPTGNSANASSAPNAMRCAYSFAGSGPMDDWFFTNGLVMQVGKSYQLQFKYRSSAYTEALEVKAGTGTTAASQTATVFSNTNIVTSTYVTTTAGGAPGQVTLFTPTANGTYYFGFHCISANNQFYLYVDDVVVTEVNAPACPQPTGLVVSNTTSTSVTVAFSGPTAGTAYSIIYGPTGFDPATAGTTVTATTSPLTLSNLASSTTYQVYVRATCGTAGTSGLTGPLSFTTDCAAVTTYPYVENFDGVTVPALPCGITLLNANGDATTWANSTITPNSSPNAMRYGYNFTNAADDWFFTKALVMQAGATYQLQFKYRAGSASYTEALEVKVGAGRTAATQTTTVFSNLSINNATTYTTTTAGPTTANGRVVSFTPTTTGTYYFGFHAISPANGLALVVDDVRVEETGIAACPTPSGLTLTNVTSTSATLSFAGSSQGTSYTIIYGAPGFNPATGGTTITVTGSPVTLSGLSAITNYDVYVRANCGSAGNGLLAGPVNFTTACAAAAIPYLQNFDGVVAPALPCVTVVDVNNDGATWANTAANPSSSPNAMRYTYNNGSAADDWFFTPALPLLAGKSYQLQFKYRAGTYRERLEVAIGATSAPASQTTQLFLNTNITNTTYATTTSGTNAGQVNVFAPTSSGNYYVGFHAISGANASFIYVDDVSVTETTLSTKNNVAPGFSAQASPVPFGERLTVALTTLAAGPAQLTLCDALGRVVRETTATVPAGASSLALPQAGTLPAGIYLLTVRQGGNTQVIRVAHE